MAGEVEPKPMTARAAGPLSGSAEAPGDKSVSHRALILGALAVGETRIEGLLEGEDVLATARAMQALGATVERDAPGAWRVQGVGVGGFLEPGDVIDCGNSGTGVRLIMGAVATTDIAATFTGDASLRARPMARVTEPLTLFGAETRGRRGGLLPITLTGAANPIPVQYTTPVASAQVKSAVLLAGLNAPGETVVIEPRADPRPHRAYARGVRRQRRDRSDRRGPRHHPARAARAFGARDRGAARPELGRLPAGGGADGARLGGGRCPGSG